MYCLTLKLRSYRGERSGHTFLKGLHHRGIKIYSMVTLVDVITQPCIDQLQKKTKQFAIRHADFFPCGEGQY